MSELIPLRISLQELDGAQSSATIPGLTQVREPQHKTVDTRKSIAPSTLLQHPANPFFPPLVPYHPLAFPLGTLSPLSSPPPSSTLPTPTVFTLVPYHPQPFPLQHPVTTIPLSVPCHPCPSPSSTLPPLPFPFSVSCHPFPFPFQYPATPTLPSFSTLPSLPLPPPVPCHPYPSILQHPASSTLPPLPLSQNTLTSLTVTSFLLFLASKHCFLPSPPSPTKAQPPSAVACPPPLTPPHPLPRPPLIFASHFFPSFIPPRVSPRHLLPIFRSPISLLYLSPFRLHRSSVSPLYPSHSSYIAPHFLIPYRSPLPLTSLPLSPSYHSPLPPYIVPRFLPYIAPHFPLTSLPLSPLYTWNASSASDGWSAHNNAEKVKTYINPPRNYNPSSPISPPPLLTRQRPRRSILSSASIHREEREAPVAPVSPLGWKTLPRFPSPQPRLPLCLLSPVHSLLHTPTHTPALRLSLPLSSSLSSKARHCESYGTPPPPLKASPLRAHERTRRAPGSILAMSHREEPGTARNTAGSWRWRGQVEGRTA
ncbi:hypothetical protein C7M84_009643 [Penaeus vannamei]|uniref:Uncharacterized protein n=1 Tax=Penaeus vannamei TaxID=6689 RepID=A0A423T6H3_PENVA|nr:hypothetical protein C7M84_009643 [Penaeus vannamei]